MTAPAPYAGTAGPGGGPLCDQLDAFADGELGPDEAARVRGHLAECADCQRRLRELSQLDGLAAAATERWKARQAERQQRERKQQQQEQHDKERALERGRRRWRMTLLVGALAAGLVPPVILGARWHDQRQLSSDQLAVLESGGTRPLEGRFAVASADAHRPYGTLRAAAAASSLPLGPAARLEQRQQQRTLAAGYALHGQLDEAARRLDALPASPDRDSDRAAVELARDQAEEALAWADKALTAQPGHTQATWNRAFALLHLDLQLAAAAAFDEVAAKHEPGWSDEARERATELRRTVKQAHDDWAAANRAGSEMVAGGSPVPLETARKFPGLTRVHFYHAVRSAPTKERVLTLLPLAATLDQMAAGRVLQDYVQRIARADFARRAPAARAYNAMVQGPPIRDEAAAEAVIEKMRKAGQPDLVMGALIFTDREPAHLSEYVALAEQSKDPWLVALARGQQALAQQAAGKTLDAERTLLSSLSDCRLANIGYRCAALEDQLVVLYTLFYRPAEAKRHARAESYDVQQGHEWGSQLRLLQYVAQIAVFQDSLSLASAYLSEAELRDQLDDRDGGCCACRRFVCSTRARIQVERFDFEGARRTLRELPRCGKPLPLDAAAVMAELARRGMSPEELADLRAELAAQRPMLGPGRRALADVVEGQALIESDRAAGHLLLERAISGAEQADRLDYHALRARQYAHLVLVADAGRSRDYDSVLDLLAADLGAKLPDRCVLGVSAPDERSILAVRDAAGVTSGRFLESGVGRDFVVSAANLVTADVRDRLAGCESVSVLAQPPVQGSPDLLPPSMAWSYRVRGVPGSVTRDPAVARRVVVSDIDAPSFLHLPQLGPWQSDAEAKPALHLRGAAATPAAVLAAIEEATEVEFHAHGLVNLGISDVSHLVLSQSNDGSYALTAGDIRHRRLAGHPLVILGACRAAEAARYQYQSWSLPIAFVEAGAVAVLAAAADIPDLEAGVFFGAVKKRLRSGQPAAVALRDERMALLGKDRASWAGKVLLFESSLSR